MVKRAKSLDKLGRISLLFRIIFIIINIEVMYMKKEIEITIDHLTKDGVGVAKVEKNRFMLLIVSHMKKFKFLLIMKGKEIFMVI